MKKGDTKYFTMSCTEAEFDMIAEYAQLTGKNKATAVKDYLSKALPRELNTLRKDSPNYLPWKKSGKGTFLENLTYNGLLKLDQKLKKSDKPKTMAERLHEQIH